MRARPFCILDNITTMMYDEKKQHKEISMNPFKKKYDEDYDSEPDYDLESEDEIEESAEEIPDEEEDDLSAPSVKHGRSKTFLMVMITLGIILILLIVAVVKILVWNKGVDYHFDAPEDPSCVEVETLDFYATMSSADLAGHDDGVTQVLFLGDDIFSYGDSSTSIASYVGAQTDAVIYNCGFSGSTMASVCAPFTPEYCNDAFSFVRIASAIASNDFSLIDEYKYGADIYTPEFEDAITTLESIDFNQLDILIIDYGTHDYQQEIIMTNVNNLSASNSYSGALILGVQKLQEAYPHLRIAVVSPTFCFYDEGNGTLTGGDIRRVGETEDHLAGYISAIASACVDPLYITFLDCYLGSSLNVQTAQQYMDDAIHVKPVIRKEIADKIVDFLQHKLYVY